MFRIVLYQPEIPPNTGNIIRLCANTGAELHLIEPLGFSLDDKRMRRAGLDYGEWARLVTHPSLEQFLSDVEPVRVFGFSTKGRRLYHQVDYEPGDTLLFGPETRGLPASVLTSLSSEQVLRLPMQPNSRSLNLSNTVSIVLYEAWRQQGFISGE